jgi:Tfp pilus assembly protein FimT
MLLVVGIIGIVGGVGLAVSMDGYRGYAFRAERNILISVLQEARTEAMNNINQTPHGVAVVPADYPDGYVVFEGETYATRVTARDRRIPLTHGVSFLPGSLPEVVFGQLSASTTPEGAIIVSDGVRNASIIVNREGRISWDVVHF